MLDWLYYAEHTVLLLVIALAIWQRICIERMETRIWWYANRLSTVATKLEYIIGVLDENRSIGRAE